MYIPAVNRVEDPVKINAFLHAYGFATLVTGAAGKPWASHLPVLFDEATGVLRSHMALANEQWRQFAADNAAKEVLCIFHGPHAYISPSWYVQQHTVPTWNYAAVHVYGVATVVTDPTAVKQIVLDTTAKYEAGMPQPWQVPLSETEFAGMLKAIVGFSIKITRIEAKFKLGQNKSAADREATVRGLLASGQPVNVELAEFTRGQLGM